MLIKHFKWNNDIQYSTRERYRLTFCADGMNREPCQAVKSPPHNRWLITYDTVYAQRRPVLVGAFLT